MSALTKYKEYWDREAVRERILNEKLRKKAKNVAGRLAEILAREFSVKRVVLFGSVLGKGEFREDSDIDLAVEGLDKCLYFSALARLMMNSSFNVDLKPVEEVSNLLRKKIEDGEMLYEKR